ncbi:hypothetical protein RUND412_006039 [Rhizina undulata]
MPLPTNNSNPVKQANDALKSREAEKAKLRRRVHETGAVAGNPMSTIAQTGGKKVRMFEKFIRAEFETPALFLDCAVPEPTLGVQIQPNPLPKTEIPKDPMDWEPTGPPLELHFYDPMDLEPTDPASLVAPQMPNLHEQRRQQEINKFVNRHLLPYLRPWAPYYPYYYGTPYFCEPALLQIAKATPIGPVKAKQRWSPGGARWTPYRR